jgi:hypothetical protein
MSTSKSMNAIVKSFSRTLFSAVLKTISAVSVAAKARARLSGNISKQGQDGNASINEIVMFPGRIGRSAQPADSVGPVAEAWAG